MPGNTKQSDSDNAELDLIFARWNMLGHLQLIEAVKDWHQQELARREMTFAARGQAAELRGRIDERECIALDNYRGKTFYNATNWQDKFQKFIENNERRLRQLTQSHGADSGKGEA